MKRAIILTIFSFSILLSQAQNIDINLLRQINSNHSAVGINTMKAFTSSFLPVSLGVPVTIITAGWIKKDTSLYLKGVNIALASGANLVITYMIKYTVKRPRPFVTYPFIIPETNDIDQHSFPSMHTSALFATATSLSLNFPKWFVIIPAYAWASTVGYSRMYLGVHYPSDVFAGALIGAGCAYISWKGQQWISGRYPHVRKRAILF